MNAPERRYRYSRPAVEDRESWLDRVLWARDVHPWVQFFLIAPVSVALIVEIAYQVALAVARVAQQPVP